ncbi:laccase-2 [Folsomia candida]|uniref:Laccase-2 n=1 Tax=Folsomia candida TaxID=158441 RepID=A0A226DNR7_FOLCA|nr:laccase-2 [Folsomia candida]XP_035712703.1 laccase-2 [Folsomia candida]XP_035712704.1 laccase-2 [Folsomia candida]XP_035712705.1 laccase-2 [Folsomia candida]OXA46740.1 Laccase-2 [Folsomia candida]
MLKVSNIYPILLLFWGQCVLPQEAPPFLDKFCILCNNSCEDGPNFHRWIVSEQVVAPDNFEQVGKVINGQFPGPTITIGTFQHLVVLVENRLSVPLTIHWHGLHQDRTVAADGAGFVTQADIPPNGKYTYCMFIEDEPGTHMYHAHTDIDIIWIHGALIVKDNNPPIWAKTRDAGKYHYDEERLLILEQLYHEPVERFVQSLTTAGVPRPATQSLMINGQSFGVWPTGNSNAEGYSLISVQRMKTYRFRIINLSSELMFRFEIEDHSMTVIEMDGIICVQSQS